MKLPFQRFDIDKEGLARTMKPHYAGATCNVCIRHDVELQIARSVANSANDETRASLIDILPPP
jgi:hypothetical protein